jgi:hypothetical protein
LRTIPGFIQSAQKSSSRTDCSKSTGSTGAGAGRANRTRSSMPLVLGPQSVRTPYDADGGPAEPRSNAKRFGPPAQATWAPATQLQQLGGSRHSPARLA